MEIILSYKLLLLLASTACFSILIIILRRIFFHPLSKFPGPLLGKFTDILTFSAVLKNQRTFQQYELLKKHGSPLRIGTNHLVFSDMESFADIYGQSSNPCAKDRSVYDGLSATGEVNVLNVADRYQHARLRRLIAHSFALKSLLESEAFIQSKVDDYVSHFQSIDNKSSLDILEKTHELYLDIVSQLSFGESFDCLSGKNPSAHRDVQAFFTIVPALSFAPFLKYLPIKTLQESVHGLARLVEFSRTHVSAYVARSAENLRSKGASGKFLQNLVSAIDAETETELTREELVENAIIFLTAGSGTTAATTIYLIWECGRQPEIRKRLIEEIRTAFPDPAKMPSYKDASKLKYLSYAIEETLRLRGPLNVGNPRVCPGKSLSGHFVPSGVVVETCTYATVRDTRVFDRALDFDPSRWEGATKEMKQMSRPFSYGPRNCVGRHLAELALTLTIARLYQLYDVVPDTSIDPSQVRQVDHGVLEPACKNFYVNVTTAPRK